MHRIVYLCTIVFCFVSCDASEQEQSCYEVFIGKEGPSVLYKFIESGPLSASGEKRIDKESGDTLFNLLYRNPMEEMRVDTVYFYYVSDNIFKCLFKTPAMISKGLVYLEQDSLGNYETFAFTGGWLKEVRVVKFSDSGEFTELLFEVHLSGTFGFPYDYDGICTVFSLNDTISFSMECKDISAPINFD